MGQMSKYLKLNNKKRVLFALLLVWVAFSPAVRAESEYEIDFSGAEEVLEEEASESTLDAIMAETEASGASFEGDCVQHTFSVDPGDCDNKDFFWRTRKVASCEQFGQTDPGLREILGHYASRGQATGVSYRCNGGSAYILDVKYDTCTATVCTSGVAARTDTQPSVAPSIVRAKLSGRLSPKVFRKRKRCALWKRYSCKQNRIRYYPRANGSCCLFGRKRR